jgi:hypothetical protein
VSHELSHWTPADDPLRAVSELVPTGTTVTVLFFARKGHAPSAVTDSRITVTLEFAIEIE